MSHSHSSPVVMKPVQAVPDNAGELINRLFRRLKTIFPAWESAFEDDEHYHETKQFWLENLANEGVLKPALLKRGLDYAVKSGKPFFPSIGQFITWCKQENYAELGLPNMEQLLRRFTKFQGYYKHDQAVFVYENQVEYWLLCELYRKTWNKPADELEKYAKKVLKQAVERVQTGEPFPDIPKQIEPPKTEPATPEQVDDILRKYGVKK